MTANFPEESASRGGRQGPLHRSWPVLVVGTAGGAWGLGLARFLAEATLWRLPCTSPLLVGALVITGAIGTILLYRLAPALFASTAFTCWSWFVPLVLPLLYAFGVISRPLGGAVLLAGSAVLVALLHWHARPRWALPVLLGLVVFFLYLRTLLPSVGESDTFEFQVVAPKLGVAHPTGYPLYVLLAKAFTFLPLRNVAWRVNLASAVFGALAVVAVYGVTSSLTRRQTRSGRALEAGAVADASSTKRPDPYRDWPALLSALAFGVSATFWSQAVAAEVYTLHNLLLATIMYLVLREGRPVGTRLQEPRWRWPAVCFLLGLSLANHLTTALLMPGLLLSFIWDRPAWRVRDWLVAVACFLAGLLPYLFIPLRWPALHDGQWMTAGEFLRYITGGQFHGALRLDGWQDPTRWRIVARLIYQPFGWPGLALAAIGLSALAHRQRRAAALTGATFLAFVAYGLNYYVADIAVFLLPGHLILAVWMGVGMGYLIHMLGSPSRLAFPLWRPLLVACIALIPLTAIPSNLPAVDRSGDQGGRAWGQYVLSQPLESGSAILADTKKFAPLYYLQQVEGLRPDLDIVLLGTEALYQADLRRRLAAGQTVYLARYLPGLDDLHLSSMGPVVRVDRKDSAAVDTSRDPMARLGDAVELLAAQVEKDPLERDLYHVTLNWRASDPVSADFLVHLRLVDAQESVAWESDGVRPVNQLYPMTAWPLGVPIADYHELPIAPWLPPGTYSLQVGLFPSPGDPALEGGEEAEAWASIGDLDVQLVQDDTPLGRGELLAFEGGVWLTGADLPDEGVANGCITLDLAWRGNSADEAVRFVWRDGDGGGIEAGTFSLISGMARSRHRLALPAAPGVYTLHIGLEGRTAHCGWLGSPQIMCALGDVRAAAGDDELANFGGRIVLSEASIDRDEMTPGDVMRVTLRWRGIRTVDVDYTVFVHLVGPDGRLHGQDDSWPVHGTLPTSEWVPGREVIDVHDVRLEADAPPGPYRVVVGFYRLETMGRLRILDPGGDPLGDSFIVGEFEVP